MPGAGKTTIVLALAYILAILRRDTNVRLVVTEPTKAMADEFFEKASSLFEEKGFVARVGLDDSTGEEHWDRHMEAAVESGIRVQTDTLLALDFCIEGVVRRLRDFAPTARFTEDLPRGVLRLACVLLAKRHAYLHSHVYKHQLSLRVEAAAQVKLEEAFCIQGSPQRGRRRTRRGRATCAKKITY